MFAELLAKTNYSFLEGASFPEEIVREAHALGYQALGVTDRNGVYGAPRAHVAAKEIGLPLIIGAELQVEEGPIFLLAQNRQGYGDLCQLLSYNVNGPAKLSEKAKDLICLAFPSSPLDFLKEIFGDRLYLVASRYLDGHDRVVAIKKYDLPVVASNQPLFHHPDRKPLQDVLTCIRHTTTLSKAGFLLLPNRERCLKPIEKMRHLFRDHPEWITNTLRVAERCRFSLDEIRYHYPNEWLPQGETGDTFLRKLVLKGANERYGAEIPEAVHRQLEHELTLIRDLDYSDYFLTIWDIVEFAKREAILCQGRGSAANSLVCYLLGITAIDPVRMNLLFERFISRERKEPPDIDIDFEHERREEVIQYIYRRFGRHRAAITAEVICFRRRSALREVAKVFEIAEPQVKKLLTLTHRTSFTDIPKENLEAAATGVPAQTLWRYLAAVSEIGGFPRHLGTHVGGFVLCQDDLSRNVPIEKAAMEDRTIVQWDKNDLDNLGFVRVDILGLGILTCIRKSLDYLSAHYGKSLTLASIPAEDPKVYDIIEVADTVGVFQIESRAQMNMLPRLRPRNFFDLVVEISLVRPGPIQGEMVHPYLRRRMGREKVDFVHPDLEPILAKTYGVPLFQEQVMKIAMAVAGFSPGEADELRRAMGAWRRSGKDRLNIIGERFRQGLLKRGVPEDYADRIRSQIEGFAEYGFPESHAASFAILAYATAWLKAHHPDVFLLGLLNAQPMGFYASHTLIQDAVRHGVKMRGADINLSTWDNRLEEASVARLGFREVRGLAKHVVVALEKARAKKPFSSFSDTVSRLQEELRPKALTKRDLFLLAGANAFESVGLDRRSALWEIQGLSLQDSHLFSPEDLKAALPKEQTWEGLSLDLEAQGVTLSQHPMAFLRPELSRHGIEDSRSIHSRRPNSRVKAAGIVICRQMPETASGVLFVTLEDEHGFLNLVVWRKIYDEYREPLMQSSFLLCEGKIQKAEDGEVRHLIVDRARPLLSRDPRVLSHDFH